MVQPLPQNYIWEHADDRAIEISVRMPCENNGALRAVFFERKGKYRVAAYNPYTRNFCTLPIDQIPDTVDRLKTMIQEKFRVFEKQDVQEKLKANRVDRLMKYYSITGTNSDPDKVELACIEKIDKLSETIVLVEHIDYSSIERKAERLLDALKLSDRLEIATAPILARIKDQIISSLIFLAQHQQRLLQEAEQNESGFIYLRPQDQLLRKRGTFKAGGLYDGCHLQICKDGRIYLIPKEHYLKMGSGTYKTVRLAVEIQSEKLFAAASVGGSPLYFEKEILLLKQLYPGSIGSTIYLKSGLSKFKAKLILPFARHGDLDLAIRKKSPFLQKIGKTKLMSLVAEIVAKLHAHGVIVRDLKLENLLLAEVDGKPEVWFLDLGLSNLISQTKKREMGFGTSRTMPPESHAFRARRKHMLADDDITDPHEKVDLFALGILLFQIDKGSPTASLPWFQEVDYKDNPHAINNYRLTFERYARHHPEFAPPKDIDETFLPRSLDQLIMWLTHPNPQIRPSAETTAKVLSILDQENIPASEDPESKDAS